MKNYIYHIRYKEDNNNIDKGYIGLTSNPEMRKSEHFSALYFNIHKNYKLQKAFNERSNDIEFVLYKEFDNRESASLLEETIRPFPNIGWNIAVGGDKKYSDRFNNKLFNIQNEFIDQVLFQDSFLIQNSKFSLRKKIMRYLFNNIINRFIISKQILILNNIFVASNFLPHISSNDLILEAWKQKEDMFFGNWGAIPHDIIAVGYALCIQIKNKNLDIYVRRNYFFSLSKIIIQLSVNGKLFNFNQIDAILINLIIIDYFLFGDELKKDKSISDKAMEELKLLLESDFDY